MTAGEVRAGRAARPDCGGEPGGGGLTGLDGDSRARGRSYRAAAREHGAVAALNRLHTELSPGVLPAGAGGYVLVPSEVAAVCDHYETPAGPRSRAGAEQVRLAQIPVSGRELTVLRIAGAGPAGGPGSVTGWQLGLGWYRLGLADRLLSQAVRYLRGRSSGGTALIDLPQVRALLADAVSGTAEASALLDAGVSPDALVSPDAAVSPVSLQQAHRALSEVGRGCLELFGAAGFLVDGPGSEVRASELLADTYAPAGPPEAGPPEASPPEQTAQTEQEWP